MLIIANDGMVLDTNTAVRFDEQLMWNGFGKVGKFSYTASEDCRQTLFCVGDDYYLTEITADNRVRFANHLSHENATSWLISNGHTLPSNLPILPPTPQSMGGDMISVFARDAIPSEDQISMFVMASHRIFILH